MSKRCQCTVVAYDYSGYGRSTGKPSERNIYADIEAVVKALVERYRIPTPSMIMYGESIGSAPALDMASRVWVAGVILHAPIKSGLRTYYGYGKRSWLCDPFPNMDTIRRIDAPGLQIHDIFNQVIITEFNSSGNTRYERPDYRHIARNIPSPKEYIQSSPALAKRGQP